MSKSSIGTCVFYIITLVKISKTSKTETYLLEVTFKSILVSSDKGAMSCRKALTLSSFTVRIKTIILNICCVSSLCNWYVFEPPVHIGFYLRSWHLFLAIEIMRRNSFSTEKKKRLFYWILRSQRQWMLLSKVIWMKYIRSYFSN